MKKVLVLGGTRFFGKRLVQKLIDKGYDVTIATRGLTKDHFGLNIKRIKIDRSNPSALKELSTQNWDLVYDNICYSPNEAMEIISVLKGKVKKYIFTSSMSVYGEGLDHKEEDFDPSTYKIEFGNREDFSYAEGKRQAEAVFFQKANFPVVATRFPIVLGIDDYTNRLAFHINNIIEEKEIVASDLSWDMTFIDSDETASFLLWVGEEKIEGPINACSNGMITLEEIIHYCEESLQKKANIQKEGLNENRSPFDGYLSLNNEKAVEAGFQFLNVHEWMRDLINQYCKSKN